MALLSNKVHEALRVFHKDFQWIHISIGLLGNLLFFIGSVFFLYEQLKEAGIWLFIVGSFAMMIGSIGTAVVRYVEKKQQN